MNPITGKYISSAITQFTKADALLPIAALEGVVVIGRTHQAYKRGKEDEARERFIEETMGSIVWLCGVGAMNKLGDKIVGRILKKPNANFDVGTDKILRTPFENYMKKVAPKGFSPNQVAMIKGTKVLASVLITNLFIGFVVPKLNQALTNKMINKRKNEQKGDKLELSTTKNPAFKGSAALNAMNKFTNAIENSNTGKLLSSDAGIAGGRMYNARRKEERREVFIRDVGSIYFYMWAQGHVRNVLNFVESGKTTRLNPSSAEILDKYLVKFLNNREMTVEEFKNAVLGKEVALKDGLIFESNKPSAWEKLTKQKPLEVIKLSDAEKIYTDPEIINRMKEMSKLQPERVEVAVLTKQQLKDVLNKAEINNPKLLDEVFTNFVDGANKNPYKYVSNKKLYNLKAEMEQYVETICKEAKNGKINKALLEKVHKKNIMYSGINFMAGFAFAGLFLSTLIPKFQYYVTRKTTGVDAFPGLYDYENHNKISV